MDRPDRPARRDDEGYTLIELVVVLLIIGILASFGVPQYLKTTETNKFDDAVALVNQIGTTNKMFALDHNGVYVAAPFPAVGSGTTSCSCNSGTCGSYTFPPSGTFADPAGTACPLVCCNYLSDQNWTGKAYNFSACNGNASTSCAGTTGTYIAGAKRNATTSYAPYKTWGITMTVSGQITANGTTPPVVTY